ncbi:MAG: hypothetical protein AB7H79_02465 [Sphingomonas sp.]
MSDWRSRDAEGLEERLSRRERRERKEEVTLADLINDSVRKVVTAIVAAGALIGAGVYLSGDEVEAPKYQVTTTSDGRVIRVNTQSGTVIACEGERCGIVVRRGQDLDDSPPARIATPNSDARPALPAPATTPDNATAGPANR